MTDNNEQSLPSVCPEHPDAEIRHTWDRKHYVLNGLPAGAGLDTNHRYECAVCGRQVCSSTEFGRRLEKACEEKGAKAMNYYEEGWTWNDLAGELRARGIDLSEINSNSALRQSVIQHLDEQSPSAAAEEIAEDCGY
ncbi:MAG: hypothetical protein ACOC6B_07105 [Thermodesulfobacteriota bacterium]